MPERSNTEQQLNKDVRVHSGNNVVHHNSDAAVHFVEPAGRIRLDNVEYAKDKKCSQRDGDALRKKKE
jgi:hypothetical protein